jgi:hypothetical protein
MQSRVAGLLCKRSGCRAGQHEKAGAFSFSRLLKNQNLRFFVGGQSKPAILRRKDSLRKWVPCGDNFAMNELKMSLQHSILTLWQHGWSFRRIARELQLRRETVSKYVRRDQASKPAKVPARSEGVAEPKPAISTLGFTLGRQSFCQLWQPQIEAAVSVGLSAQRIYQDLVGGHRIPRVWLTPLAAGCRAVRCRAPMNESKPLQYPFLPPHGWV